MVGRKSVLLLRYPAEAQTTTYFSRFTNPTHLTSSGGFLFFYVWRFKNFRYFCNVNLRK